MTNKEFREKLQSYPDDAVVAIEYCDIQGMRYDEKTNIIYID